MLRYSAARGNSHNVKARFVERHAIYSDMREEYHASNRQGPTRLKSMIATTDVHKPVFIVMKTRRYSSLSELMEGRILAAAMTHW